MLVRLECEIRKEPTVYEQEGFQSQISKRKFNNDMCMRTIEGKGDFFLKLRMSIHF